VQGVKIERCVNYCLGAISAQQRDTGARLNSHRQSNRVLTDQAETCNRSTQCTPVSPSRRGLRNNATICAEALREMEVRPNEATNVRLLNCYR